MTVADILNRAADLIEPEGAWGQVFAHRVDPQSNGCLHFVGARLPSGYGKVGHRGQSWLAHRLSLHLYLSDDLGTPRGDEIVMHTCDDPRCINPHHLHAVSAAENTADMIAKGRAGWQLHPERFVGGLPPRLAGQQNGRARFSDDEALAIIRKRAAGASYSTLMGEYGASKSTIATIWKRRQFPERTQAEVVAKLREAAMLAEREKGGAA